MLIRSELSIIYTHTSVNEIRMAIYKSLLYGSENVNGWSCHENGKWQQAEGAGRREGHVTLKRNSRETGATPHGGDSEG